MAITRLGRSEAIIFGDPSAIDTVARTSEPIAGNLTEAACALARATPEILDTGQSLSGRWVKLTRESIEALDRYGPSGAPGGGFYGVVRGPDGSIVQHLSFIRPTGAAQLATALGSIGLAAAMQLQQAQVERRLKAIQQDLSAVVSHLKDETLAGLTANVRILELAYRSVELNGRLTDDNWDLVANSAQSVQTLHDLTSRQLRSLETVLANPEASLPSRVKALNRALHEDRTLLWLEAHVHAELTLLRWQYLYLLRQIGQEPQTAGALIADLELQRAQRYALLQRLAGDIASYLTSGTRTQSILERIRIISRVRLDVLFSELEAVLAAYRESLAPLQVERRALPAPPTQAELTPGSPDEAEQMWRRMLNHLGPLPEWVDSTRGRVTATSETVRRRIDRRSHGDTERQSRLRR